VSANDAFQGAGHLRDDLGRIGKRLGGFLFALSLDDSGPFFADGFGLARNGPLHLFGNVEILDLDGIHHHTPLLAGPRQKVEQTRIDRGAILQDLVEIALTDGIAQARFGGLHHRALPIDDRGDDLHRIDSPEPQHGIDPHRHAVPRHGLLRVQREGDGPQINLDDPLDERDQPIKAWSFRDLDPAEPEQDTALIFLIDPEGFERKDQTSGQQEQSQTGKCCKHHRILSSVRQPAFTGHRKRSPSRSCQAFLQCDMKVFRALPWIFLASASLEQASDFAVRGACPLPATGAGFAGAPDLADDAATLGAGFAGAGLVCAAAFIRLKSEGLVGAGDGACAMTEVDTKAAATASNVSVVLMGFFLERLS
jgi:hypothetical protein